MNIEDTSKRDPALHLMGSTSKGTSTYITDIESAGQQQLVADSTLMPADGPWDELMALGFGAPEPTDDDLFVKTTLPAGWSKTSKSHPMWSDVEDGREIRRVSVFYKAAFYDRRANCSVVSVGNALASDLIYGDEPVCVPKQWESQR